MSGIHYYKLDRCTLARREKASLDDEDGEEILIEYIIDLRYIISKEKINVTSERWMLQGKVIFYTCKQVFTRAITLDSRVFNGALLRM